MATNGKASKPETQKEASGSVENEAAFLLACIAHGRWLMRYWEENGLKPRIKPLPSGEKINIALPAYEITDWIKFQAKTVFQAYVDRFNPTATDEDNAAAVHEVWMEQNEWQREQSPHLFVPYDQLAVEEQKKDLDIVHLIREHN
jgi:hypothetical protein